MITYFIWEVKFIFCLNRGFSQITRIARILRGFLLVRGVTCQNQDLLDWRIFRIINLVELPMFADLEQRRNVLNFDFCLTRHALYVMLT